MKKIVFYTTILLCLTSSLTFGQVKEYFIDCDPADFEFIYQHYDEDIYIPISFTYNGTTWTNTEMRIRGDGSRSLPKKSLKVRFNDEPFVNGRDKLNFNAEYEDRSYIRAFVSSRIFKMTGQHCFDTDFTRLYLNGDFLGLYQMTENMDDLFLEANGYDPSGNLFKATKDGACLSIYDDVANFWEQKTGSGNKEDLALLIENINAVSVEEYPDFCQQTMNYDKVVNMIACNMVISNQSTYYHNYYMYHDVNGSGKWEMIPWDLDKTISVYSWRNYTYSSALWTSDNPYMEKAILNEQMMEDIKIRSQEIFDQVVNTEQLWPMIDSLVEVLQPSVAQDTTDDITDVEVWLERVEVEKTVIANSSGNLNWYFNHVQSSFCAERTPHPMPKDITFRWSPSIDPEGEPVRYRFLLTTGIKFETELTTIYEDITDTSFTIQNIEPGNYFWQVVSIDASGEEVQAFDSRNPLEVKNFSYLPCVINQNLTLSVENSPYLIDCDLEVVPNKKLTIPEGVEIVFTDQWTVTVYGEILAEGSEQSPIIFRPDVNVPSWDGLYLINATGTCIFKDVEFVNGRLNAENTDLSFNNIEIKNSMLLEGTDALISTMGGNIEIKQSKFLSNNTGRGLDISAPQSVLIENSYFNQVPNTINFSDFNGGIITKNLLSNGQDNGISLNNVHNTLIQKNKIYNSSQNAILLNASTNAELRNNLISGSEMGISLLNDAQAMLIQNTLYQNENSIWLARENNESGGGQVSIINSILSNSGAEAIYADEHSSWTMDYSLCDTEEIEGTNNLFANPEFVASADSNFTLLPISPCIDSGDPDSQMDPDSTQADMGAFFFNQGTFNVVFNEINYKSSPDFDTEDWVELYNAEDGTADVSGWVFKDSNDDHIFEFPFGTNIEPDGYLVLCSNANMFAALNPEIENYIGSFPYGLSSNGELIRLYNHTGILINSVVYGVENPWPEAPNGGGPTLELRNPLLNNTQPENWCGTEMYGTPGKVNSCSFSGSSQNESVPFKMQLFPNPGISPVNLRFDSEVRGNLEIQIFTGTGEHCYSKLLTVDAFEKFNLLINNLSEPGLYLVKVKLEREDGRLFQQNSKLIVLQ